MSSYINPRILQLFPGMGSSLDQAEYLPEYDAIHLQTSWDGLCLATEGASIVNSVQELDQRSRELTSFFSKGGVLLIELRATPSVVNAFAPRQLDPYGWWAMELELPYPEDPLTHQRFVDTSASGKSVLRVVPGHPLDTYLQGVKGYELRFGNYVAASELVTTLAENRSGDALAIEAAIGRGAMIAVPPPNDDNHRMRLSIDLREILRNQVGQAHEWPLPDEETLRIERERVLTTLADERRRLDRLAAEIQSAKARVLQEPHVRRALRYWERASRVGTPPKTTVDELYSLIEMLKDYSSVDWKSLGQTIGVSNNSIDRIKRFANRPELHLRHTNAADPHAIDQSELDRVVQDGHAIVAKFIEQRYRTIKRNA